LKEVHGISINYSVFGLKEAPAKKRGFLEGKEKKARFAGDIAF
jgi:hypothetical protein